jgi:MOSC domain
MEIRHLTVAELEAGLDEIRRSPADGGLLRMIVRRPREYEREVLADGQLDLVEGLVGDDWSKIGSSMTPDGSPHPEMQITIMNARAIALLAQSEERWQLAGDQLYVDLDLSADNLPPGTRLQVGDSAILEVTAVPHTGCKQFAERFGTDATKFVNSPEGKYLHLRGINTRVVNSGTIKTGDVVRKL